MKKCDFIFLYITLTYLNLKSIQKKNLPRWFMIDLREYDFDIPSYQPL